MMLLEDFYNVQSSSLFDNNAFKITVELHKNHDIFKGHFPNFPVTPGVVMLQIIKNEIELKLSQSLQIQSSTYIKFLNLVIPEVNTILIFNIHLKIEDDVIKVKNSTTFKDGSAVLKCNVTFVKK